MGGLAWSYECDIKHPGILRVSQAFVGGRC